MIDAFIKNKVQNWIPGFEETGYSFLDNMRDFPKCSKDFIERRTNCSIRIQNPTVAGGMFLNFCLERSPVIVIL